MTGWVVDAPLVTERLLVRPWRESDLDDLHSFQSDPDVVALLRWEVRTREESLEWLRARMVEDALLADGDPVSLALERRSDGRVVGSVNAWWTSVRDRQGEVGFVLAEDAQGQGYAYEATVALVDELFARLDLHRVIGTTDGRNSASAALLRRLGMREEALFRESTWVKGEWRDERVFAVLRPEWEAARREAPSSEAP